MSSPAHSTRSRKSTATNEDASTETSSPAAKRTRLTNRDHSSLAESTAAAATVISATPLAPSTKLHRHALESIFEFLSLAELSQMMAVSHSWSAAVMSMRSIAADFEPSHLDSIMSMCSSRLRRHVTALIIRDAFTISVPELQLITAHMPHLHGLHCVMVSLPPISITADIALTRLTQLIRISMNFMKGSSAEQMNSLIRQASQLPLLTAFSMELYDESAGPLLNFAPLRSAPILEDLYIRLFRDDITDAQVDDIRAMPHLSSVNLFPDATLLRRLLREPHQQLQWKSLDSVSPLDHASALLLPLLPSLTHLCASFTDANPSFLQYLPNLRQLTLLLRESHATITPQQWITALQSCPELTNLELFDCKFTSAQMCEILPCMPNLNTLSIQGATELESLRFLSRGPITCTLTDLSFSSLSHPQLHSTELEHVHALMELKSLWLSHCFVEPLDAFALHLYSRPYSLLLPKLIDFSYYNKETEKKKAEAAEIHVVQA